MSGKNVLFVDLNNSARFPTLTIGYLVAALRAAGAKVKVLSPLAVGVPGHQRDLADTIWTHLQRRLFFSGHWAIHPIHNRLHVAWREWNNKPSPSVLAAIEGVLSTQQFDVILISAYLDFYQFVVEIGKRAQSAGIPLIVGGPTGLCPPESTLVFALKKRGIPSRKSRTVGTEKGAVISVFATISFKHLPTRTINDAGGLFPLGTWCAGAATGYVGDVLRYEKNITGYQKNGTWLCFRNNRVRKFHNPVCFFHNRVCSEHNPVIFFWLPTPSWT
ncbi:hypothetical protein ACXR0O_08280 [Verrucomicrobiota bacterium sgz303538]